MTDMIRTRDAGSVREIVLDRPERRNAFTREGLDGLAAAIRETDAPVIYLHGEGSAFCAGADLEAVRSLDAATAEAFARRGQETMRTVADSGAVVVAGVDGAARGGGVELALAADVRVATPNATFAEPGVALGIFGAWGGTRRLVEAVGPSQAMDLSLSGRTIDATEARRIGLISRVREDPRTVAESIAENDHDALRELQALLADPGPRDDQERREREAFARLLADGLE